MYPDICCEEWVKFHLFPHGCPVSHYCFLNSPSFPQDLKCYLYYTMLYVLTIFIYYKFPGRFIFRLFSILSHCHCQYLTVLIMEALLYTLISDMPRPLLVTLLVHGIPGYFCLFLFPSRLYK